MMRKLLVFMTLTVFASTLTIAQTLVNGGVEGTIGTSQIPPGWSPVPFSFGQCQASGSGQATSDLSDGSGNAGVYANPHGGSSCVTGLRSYVSNLPLFIFEFHEGIQQAVSGFTIGLEYRIGFYQSVTKSDGNLDSRGSWSVYFDNTLIATTAPSMGTQVWTDPAVTWDYREVTFTATSTMHTIRFLPTDDDPNIATANDRLRMGIDDIEIISPLPVELSSFSASCEGDKLLLNWQTISENDNDFFELEKSIDGIEFYSIAKIDGSGNSLSPINYQFTDNQPNRNVTYYRLSQIDFDGTATMFPAVSAKTCEERINIHPVPSSEQVTISLQGGEGPESIGLFDALGNEVVRLIELDQTQWIINTKEHNLPPGLYILKVNFENNQLMERIVFY